MKRILDKYRLWQRRRETRRELNNLTEKDLWDLGLARADIDNVVNSVR